MGYIVHHAIVVTACDVNFINQAHEMAVKYGCIVTPIGKSHINGYQSFLVCPDGSKEGWPESVEGDKQRVLFIGWLNSMCYSDGSSSLDWVEVSYGGDDAQLAKVTNKNIK